jgi:putative endonuclease
VEKMRDQRRELGQAGENLAVSFLEKNGYRIVERNWRCRYGELDIIAREGGSLVFVEVRSRRSLRYGTAAESVDWRKRKKLRQLALIYLSERQFGHFSYRFDVITVFFAGKGEPQISHIPYAF